MAAAVTESTVYGKLMQIAHPEIRNRSLVELGMIPRVQVEGRVVQVSLALPSTKIPIKDELVSLVRKAVAGMGPELQVLVDVTEMDSEQREVFFTHVREEKRDSPSTNRIDTVLAVMSGKGGVGKSSITGLLASSLRRKQFQVGVLDADITGPSIPKIFGTAVAPVSGPEGLMPVESRSGIKLISINLLLPSEDQPVVWRGPMISKVIEQFWRDFHWGQLDYLIVDLPPGTSDAALTVMQSLRLSEIVLVTSPQDLAGMVVRKAANMAKLLGVPITGLVENMSYVACPRCGERIEAYGPSRAQETAHQARLPLLGSLPIDPELAVMCDRGEVEEYRSEAFDLIVDQLLQLSSKKVVGASGRPLGA